MSEQSDSTVSITVGLEAFEQSLRIVEYSSTRIENEGGIYKKVEPTVRRRTHETERTHQHGLISGAPHPDCADHGTLNI